MRLLDKDKIRKGLVVTPLALVYNRQGKITAIRCFVYLSGQSGYHDPDSINERVVAHYAYDRDNPKLKIITSDIPLSGLTDIANFDRTQEGIVIHCCNHLGKIYSDGEVIEDYLQLCMFVRVYSIHASAYDALKSKDDVFFLLSTKSNYGAIMSRPQMSDLIHQGFNFGNVDREILAQGGIALSRNDLFIPNSELDASAYLTSDMLGTHFPLSAGRVQIPKTFFDTQTVIVEDCSYGEVYCTIHNKPNLRNLIWKGIYNRHFYAYINNCPALRSVTAPIVSDHLNPFRLQALSNFQLNMGFMPGKEHYLSDIKKICADLNDCDDVTLNINPDLNDTIVHLTINGKVHIKEIRGRGTIELALGTKAILELDDCPASVKLNLSLSGNVTGDIQSQGDIDILPIQQDISFYSIKTAGTLRVLIKPSCSRVVDIKGVDLQYSKLAFELQDCEAGSIRLIDLDLDKLDFSPEVFTVTGVINPQFINCKGSISPLCKAIPKFTDMALENLKAPQVVPYTLKYLKVVNTEVEIQKPVGHLVITPTEYFKIKDTIGRISLTITTPACIPKFFKEASWALYDDYLKHTKVDIVIEPLFPDTIFDLYSPIEELKQKYDFIEESWELKNITKPCYAVALPELRYINYAPIAKLFYTDSKGARPFRNRSFDFRDNDISIVRVFCANQDVGRGIAEGFKSLFIAELAYCQDAADRLSIKKAFEEQSRRMQIIAPEKPISIAQFLAYAEAHKHDPD